MAIEIQIRRDTAANWTSVDPILAEGEFGLETDTNQLKIGDGVLAWTALAYFGGGGNPFDQDLNTTDPVVFAGLTNNAIVYPTSDGTVGQSIVTDGAGNLSFATAGNPFDQDLNTTDPVVFAGLTNNAIIYPTSDGTVGQVIVTDGAGNLSFASAANPFDQSLNIADAVSFTGLTNNSIIYPVADGTVGQVIVTDGAGTLSFASAANPFDQDLNTTDPVVFTGLTNNAIIYPTSDGTVGQVIVTDGAGNLSFASAANPFDQDLNTTDAVVFAGLTNNSIIYPTIDGTIGQVIVTDGAGNLSFGSYLPLAGGAMDDTAIVTLSNIGTDRDTEIGGWGLGTQKTSDNDYSATFEYDQILIKDGTQTTTIKTNTITTGGSYIERQVAASFTSGTLTLDCNLANVFTHSLTADVTTLTINNIPTSGKAIGITLILEADGTQRTITWPASFVWPEGVAPTLTATLNEKDVIVFMTYDAGTTFLAFVAGTSSISGVVTSVTGTSPMVSSGGTTPAISIPAATNASAGYATAAHITAIEANTAKVTNATHTGDATGDTALTVVAINGVVMSGLATGLLKNTTSTGVPSIATAGTDYVIPSGNITGSAASLSATLAVASGGTGVTTSTGSGANALATSPTLVTPILGTPSSGTLTSCTGLPVSTGVSGLGTNVATFLATPSSANLAAALTDETGTGLAVFATSPTLTTATITSLVETKTAPAISSGTLTLNCSLGNVFAVSLNAAITTLTISNIPTTGNAFGITLAFTCDGTARAVTWPAAVKWSGGTAPTLTSTNNKVDIFVLTTWDGGTTWYAMVGGQNF